jgi:ABC-type sugar transport system ATPase subunit
VGHERSDLIEARGLSKAYAGTLALDGVDITVGSGQVLAVVGANGSGKTTLLSLLCGLNRPTSGDIKVDGSTVEFTGPRDALAHGIVYIPQEPQLAQTLTAWENLLLADMGRLMRLRPGSASREKARELAAEALEGRDPDTPVSALRKAERAILSLVAGLQHEPRLLALDEPTAVLGDRGVDIVEGAIGTVVGRGGSVLLVSHRLRDIVRLATHVLVLVDGRAVYDGAMDSSTVASLIDSLTSSHEPAVSSETAPGSRGQQGTPVVTLTDVSNDGLRVSKLVVSAGEILGVAGLAGSGRSRLCRIVAGCSSYHGTIEYAGGTHRSNSVLMRRLGIAYLPEDRLREGLFPALSLERNLEIVDLAARTSLWRAWPWRPNRQKWSALADRFGIKRASLSSLIPSLSGGNQQRALLGRTLASEPMLLVADEPTQGVDRAGRAAIHKMIREFAGQNGSALVVSSEFEELQELCDRIVVLANGELVADLAPETRYRDLISYATIGELSAAGEGIEAARRTP